MRLTKKFTLLCIASIFCIIGLYLSMADPISLTLHFDDDENMSLHIKSNGREESIYPYVDLTDGIYYFFLPAYTQNKPIHINKLFKQSISINGHEMTPSMKFDYESDKIYELTFCDNTNNLTPPPPQSYYISFMCSANIPAVFLETDSGSMDFLNANKENAEPGEISILLKNGSCEYSGSLEKISGRGNSTWGYDKKPYMIKLKDSRALLGMDQGKRWYLLPAFREAGRMTTKVVMDIASALELEYTSNCTWIDLYLNGEYNGNYLLCESVTVEDGRVEINDLEKENRSRNPAIDSIPVFEENTYKGYELPDGSNVDGGYLIEKDTGARSHEKKSGFQTASGAFFTLKSPEHASREQVSYIQNHFQQIEDMIMAGSPNYEHYIDLDSFSARFLVDEISLNYDAGVSSMFFYKEKNDDLLYAGPVWDYDWSMGWGKEDRVDLLDYEYFSLMAERSQSLNWYQMLYEDETFYNQIRSDFRDLLPFMETLLDTTIDEYAETVRASALMDEVRWKNTYTDNRNRGNYEDFDNNVRYLKYFLAHRLNFLCEKWDIPYDKFSVSSLNTFHQVTFMYHDEIIEIRTIPDGETITDLPAPPEPDLAWYFTFSHRRYCDKVPIYEDCTLYANLPDTK